MVGQHSEARPWNSVCGTMKGSSHGIQDVGEGREYCLQNSLHRTMQEDRTWNSMHRTVWRRLHAASHTRDNPETVMQSLQYRGKGREDSVGHPICQRTWRSVHRASNMPEKRRGLHTKFSAWDNVERIVHGREDAGQPKEDQMCGNKCIHGTTLRGVHTASNSQDNVERHMQHPISWRMWQGRCGASNMRDNAESQACGFQYMGQHGECASGLH